MSNSLTLTDTQQCDLEVAFADKKGAPAVVDGAPVWSSSDENVAKVTASADGMKATIVSNAPGSAQISVTADADLGTGVTALVGTLDLVVVPGAAVVANLTTGTPTEQP